MSKTYGDIEALVAHMVNALYARDTTEAESNYTTRPVSAAAYQNPRFPQSLVRDQILQAEVEIIEAICKVDKHPDRGTYYDFTGNLASGDELPETIGGWGAVRTATGHKSVEPAALWLIQLWNDESITSNHYAINGNRIYHAASEPVQIEAATIEVEDRADFDDGTTIRLGDQYANFLACKALVMLPLKDGYNFSLAQAFGTYSSLYDQQIAGGGSAPPPTFPALPAN